MLHDMGMSTGIIISMSMGHGIMFGNSSTKDLLHMKYENINDKVIKS